MKHYFTLILIVTVSSLALEQLDTNSESLHRTDRKSNINTTFFILGTLTDYLGHYYYVNKPDQVDRYDPSEKPLMDYLNRIIKKDLKIKMTTILDDKKLGGSRYETFSEELSQLIKSFYRTDNLLIDSMFKNPNEIYSYLAGQFFRYGEQLNDSIFKINLTNSPNRKTCDLLLKKAEAKLIYIKDLKNNIPSHFIFYFVPSTDLKIYFDKISKQKKQLYEFEADYWAKIHGGKDEYQKAKKINQERDLSEIIQIYNNNN